MNSDKDFFVRRGKADGKEARQDPLQRLGDLLPVLSRSRGWREKLEMHSIFLRWHELLVPEISSHCKPLKIVKKILWVEAENSAWLQQFQFQSVFILECLNKSLHKSKLESLRFRVAEKEEAEKKHVSLCYVQPSTLELAEFEKQVASIADEKSREALFRFWYLSRACRWK